MSNMDFEKIALPFIAVASPFTAITGLVGLFLAMRYIKTRLNLISGLANAVLRVLETLAWIDAHPIQSAVATAIAAVIIYAIAYIIWHIALWTYYRIRPY